jgi:hypothetical protein
MELEIDGGFFGFEDWFGFEGLNGTEVIERGNTFFSLDQLCF